MKTCEMFCAACIGGSWLAFTVPRQMIPLAEPLARIHGIHQLGDELVVRAVLDQRPSRATP